MSAKYKITKTSSPEVKDMPVVTATQLKNEMADVFDLVVREGAVALHRHEKPRRVLEALTGKDSDWLKS